MLAQFGPKSVAARSARERHCKSNIRILAAIAAAGLLSSCVPPTVPLAGADPADPSARVARVGYKSTVAPYTSMRPATPAPWRERNESVAPPARPNQ